jgi:uncharacterized integral membrane protein
MGFILIALLIIFALTGTFVVQNPAAAHVSLLSYSWDVPFWAPTVIGIAAVSALLLLYVAVASLHGNFRHFGLRREVESHQMTISEMRDEIARLREELAAARGRAAAATTRPPGAGRDWRDWLRRPRVVSSDR